MTPQTPVLIHYHVRSQVELKHKAKRLQMQVPSEQGAGNSSSHCPGAPVLLKSNHVRRCCHPGSFGLTGRRVNAAPCVISFWCVLWAMCEAS